MKSQVIVLAAIIAGLPAAAIAQAANPPQEAQQPAQPDTGAPMTSANPYKDLFKQVQEKLSAEGFDPGPADGTFNSKTQAALAQFQLSRAMPASGALDDMTLWELGVELPHTTLAQETEEPRPTAAQETVAAEDAGRPPQ